jgi:hypothetical protein
MLFFYVKFHGMEICYKLAQSVTFRQICHTCQVNVTYRDIFQAGNHNVHWVKFRKLKTEIGADNI